MSLSGPDGCRQSAPARQVHCTAGARRDGSMKTSEPGSEGCAATRDTPVAGRGGCSAVVTWPVASTNSRNRALVTSVASIQTPSTHTLCAGRSSGCAPLASLPMVNSAPGIHTMSPVVCRPDELPGRPASASVTTAYAARQSSKASSMPTRGSRLVSMTAPLASRLLEALRAHVRGDDVLVERVGEAVEVEVVDAGRAPLPAQAPPVLHVLAVDDLVEVAVAGTRRLRREQLLELLEKRVEVRQLLRCEAAWRKVGRREQVVLRAIERRRDRPL